MGGWASFMHALGELWRKGGNLKLAEEMLAGALALRQEIFDSAGEAVTRAAIARWWERRENWSCSSRVIPKSRATFSAVSPMFRPQTGSVRPSWSPMMGEKSAGRKSSIAPTRSPRLLVRASLPNFFAAEFLPQPALRFRVGGIVFPRLEPDAA